VGVALLGSLLSSRYLDHVDSGLASAHLPAKVVDTVSGNIQAAEGVSHSITGPKGAHILAVARDGFVSGLHLAMIVAALIALVAAAAVLTWLPSRAPAVAELTEAEAEAEAESERAAAAGEPVPS
jgi:hypothetical protein